MSLGLFSTTTASFCVAQAVAQPESRELGYPDGPEMNDYKQQLKDFEAEWERMESTLTISHSVLEIGGKSPEDLLQEMVRQMKSECCCREYVHFLVGAICTIPYQK